MRSLVARTLAALLSAALLAATATTASAAAAFPHISSFQANRAIPDRASLPGNVGLYGTMTRSLEEPCLLTDKALVEISIPATVDGGVQRAATSGGSIYDRRVSWSLEVLAFGSPHGAQAYIAKLAKAEQKCPSTATHTYPGPPDFTPYHLYSKKLAFTRASHGGWVGYHGVDQLRYAKPAHVEREVWSMLSRGNAVVFVSVTAPVTMISGAHEER
jgi:hypothetical protein